MSAPVAQLSTRSIYPWCSTTYLLFCFHLSHVRAHTNGRKIYNLSIMETERHAMWQTFWREHSKLSYKMTHGYDKVGSRLQQGHESYTSEWIIEYIICCLLWSIPVVVCMVFYSLSGIMEQSVLDILILVYGHVCIAPSSCNSTSFYLLIKSENLITTRSSVRFVL